MTFLKTEQLTKVYSMGKKKITAVDGIDLAIQSGETLGLVGESGCGKSTLGKLLLGLVPATKGQIFLDNREIKKWDSAIRRRMQIIFQDPYASLNPRMPIGEIIGEPLKIYNLPDRVDELLDCVGLPRASKNRFPHEFSGGQRQRVGIARAIALNPEFIVCDEPISALDVSIQAQIVNLLQRLQKELRLTYLFISHDLAMVRYLSNRIAVMYMGQIVETAPTDLLYANPLHPYTQLLLASIPSKKKEARIIPTHGEITSAPSQGCPFSPRCPFATSRCKMEKPQLRIISEDHSAACHLYSGQNPLKNLLSISEKKLIQT